MSRFFTFQEQRCIQAAACMLLLLSTSCSPKTGDAGYNVQLAADPATNSHLKGILFGRKRDSIEKCAEADYMEKKYYLFWAGTPGEAKFNTYLVAHAKQQYNVVLVNCGFKSHSGAFYYNNKMAALFAKANRKQPAIIYMEAKNLYHKALSVTLSKPVAGHAQLPNLVRLWP